MIYLGRSVNRTASYFVRAAAQRASDPVEFHRRYLKGVAVLQDIQKDGRQRAYERELANRPATITPLSRRRA